MNFKHSQHRRASRTVAAGALPLLLASFLLGGCQTGANSFPEFGLSELNWFNSSQPGVAETVVLPRDPASLANGGRVEKALHNAVELSRQKRFVEARHLLFEVRALQDRDSDGHHAISCAMALLALREGNIATFRRIARQLDESLGTPVRVDISYVDVISLYRAMENRDLPVNAHHQFQTLKEKHFATISAGL